MNIKEIINRAISADYTICYPIGEFTIEDLVKLSEEASLKRIELRIKAEHSNFYQGTLVEVQSFGTEKKG